MRLYIIRHADPDYPNNTITAAGHLEAAALSRRLAREKLTHIYCSPLGRAIDTARYTASECGLDPIIEEWMSEHSDCMIQVDPWPPSAVFNLAGERIRGGAALPSHDTWSQIKELNDPRFGALYEGVQRYSDAFFSRLGYERDGGRYRVVRAAQDRLAMFCHGGFGLTWLSHLLAIPLPLMWCGFWLPPSSVTTVLMEQRSAQWAVPRCMGLGDVGHLHAAGLPVQPSGVTALNW